MTPPRILCKMRNMLESEIKRLAGEAGIDPRTVKRFLKNERIQPLSEERLRAAAKKLRIKIGMKR